MLEVSSVVDCINFKIFSSLPLVFPEERILFSSSPLMSLVVQLVLAMTPVGLLLLLLLFLITSDSSLFTAAKSQILSGNSVV